MLARFFYVRMHEATLSPDNVVYTKYIVYRI